MLDQVMQPRYELGMDFTDRDPRQFPNLTLFDIIGVFKVL